jgi:protein O-mannosyl-transferase
MVILLGVCAYANSFHVPFQFDDQASILDNSAIRDVANFFTNPSGNAYNPRRYVGYLTFALNYRWGGLDITGYHVVNLAIHLANALLVYALARLTLRTPFFNPQPSTRNGSSQRFTSTVHLNPQPSSLNLLPLFAALLFVAHPLQTQAVTYIAQRLTSLATLFYLLALVLYGRMRLVQESGEGSRVKAGAWYVMAIVVTALAMKAKEIDFTLPVAIALYEWLFFRGDFGRRGVRLIPFFAAMAIIPLTLVGRGGAPTPAAGGGLLADVTAASKMETAPLSRLDYLFTQFRVIVTYLRQLFLPVNQNLDYDYPLYHSFFAPPVLASFLLLAALFVLAIYLVYRSTLNPEPSSLIPQRAAFNPQPLRLVSFGIFWFFLTLAVESSIIPIDDVINEHRVYLPSVGFVVAVITLVLVAADKLRTRAPAAGKVVVTLLAVAVLVMAGATFARNAVWRDPLSLWRDCAAKSPNKPRPLNNLGFWLTEAGRTEEAIPLLNRAIAINPRSADGYNCLGHALTSLGQSAEAIAMFQRAITLNPKHADAYNNLGHLLTQVGRPEEAVPLLEKAMALREGFADACNNLGVALYALGDESRSMAMFQRVIAHNPGYADAHNNLGVIYIRRGRIKEAIGEFQAAVAAKPGYAAARRNLEMALGNPLRGER